MRLSSERSPSAEACCILPFMTRNMPPALGRNMIVRTALDIMDRDGYAAFSMPKLSAELGIRTPSLYHHFRDREEVLVQVARAVILETEMPSRVAGAEWMDYFVALAVNFRRTILRHRNTAPVLVQYLPSDVLAQSYEAGAALLRETSPLPLSAHVLVLDGLERLTIGTALIEAARPRPAFSSLDSAQHPRLAEAVANNEADAEQLFVKSIRAFLLGLSGE